MNDSKERLQEGARIIIQDWVELKAEDRLLIVTEEQHFEEAEAMKAEAEALGAEVELYIPQQVGPEVGVFFDENETIFDPYTVIIGATDYSLVTTKATRRAIEQGKQYLSLPLSVNGEESMLAYDFIRMDTKKSRLMAEFIQKQIKRSSIMRVTTPAGTDIRMYKKDRPPGFFNGVVRDGGGYSSASFEIYIPIEETKTEGVMIVDGSFGYIGRPDEPVRIELAEGRIVDIEANPSGERLKQYIESFEDPGLYVASEFGIGLNSLAKCRGLCYIEDESAYGTYHIGFGRNVALGGIMEADGHYDLVGLEPDIYVDNRRIIHAGRIIVSEPGLF